MVMMCLGKLHSLFIILVTFMAFTVPCSTTDPTDILSSCLVRKNVYNFVLRQSPDYYRLLYTTMHNLRFVVPTAPKPAAIVRPLNLKQLVNSMQCCREGSFEFRVRSGGHSYEGLSSVDTSGKPFVIIDMINLNQVLVDVRSQTAWVEGGATLGETYYAIAEQSSVLGFTAGRCPTVGAGGHIAGGGYGLLSRKYGLAADNVVDAILIDAFGRVLDRTAMGEDVFWAIRGGGGGVWGIVYAWKIKLLEVPETVTACTVSKRGAKRYLAELLQKWQSVAALLDPSFYLSVFVGIGQGGGGDHDHGNDQETRVSASFKGFYLGTRKEAVTILNRGFRELGIKEEDCREMSWIESVLYFGDMPDGSSVSDLLNRYATDKIHFKFKSDYVRSPISREGLGTALDILEKERRGHVVLEPYGGVMENISSDALPFPHRKGNLYVIHYVVEDKSVLREESLDWIRGLYKSMTPYVSRGPRAAYVNFEDLDLGQMNSSVHYPDPVEVARAWGEKYFLNNYVKLVRVKTFIDPGNVFHNQQGIPPNGTANVDKDDKELLRL